MYYLIQFYFMKVYYQGLDKYLAHLEYNKYFLGH